MKIHKLLTKTYFTKLCVCAIFSCSIFSLSFGQDSQNVYDGDLVKNQIIVKLKSKFNFSIDENNRSLGILELDRVASEQGNYSIRKYQFNEPKTPKVNRPDFSQIATLQYDSEIDVQKAIRELQATGMFEFVEANGLARAVGINENSSDVKPTSSTSTSITPNDDWYSYQYWSENNGSFQNPGGGGPPCKVDADLDMETAWEYTTGSPNVTLAIIDTGCKMDHPEFSGRFVQGRDLINNDNDPTDDQLHGTHVAGIAAATGNNGIGHAGVDWQCKLMIVKGLDQNGSGPWDVIANCITWAVDNGADVINMSLGGSGGAQVVANAVQYARDNDVPIVAAMGNNNSGEDFYPAAYPGVISIGATYCDDTRTDATYPNPTWGSNFGSHIDVVAPGSQIYSLRHNNNNYDYPLSGTSMASPIAAGVVSLLLSVNPTLNIEEIRDILRNTAEDQVGKPSEDVPGWDQYYGSGRINAANALNLIADCDDSPEGTPCDDNNPCTSNDVYNDRCFCQGTFNDSDGDGVCDINDLCPGFDDNIDVDEDNIPDNCDNDVDCSGIACDDNDNCTVNDVYDADCSCAGIAIDEVDNGSCNMSAPYCDVSGGSLLTLNKVEIGNISNSTGGNGYTDYSNEYALIANQGESIDVLLQASLDNSGFGGVGAWVYIDFNQNGVFDNAERVVDGNGESINTSFTIPSSAPDGATMMRVYGFFDFIFITPSGPCASSEYGEIEDYAVIIGQGQQNCTPGATCNDNDSCTTNDVFDANCDCSGTYQDSDNDGVCNADDVCPGGDDTVDSDGDGIPDACDGCSVAGNPCNDGDSCTINDVFDANCNCAGTYQDSDNDGVCNANDVCPGGDDTIDSDGDGIPDACDGCNNVGNPCNDGDACTTNDVFDANCNCAGTYADADNDGVCDANDICPGGDDSIDSDGDGIPDFCDTIPVDECDVPTDVMSNIEGDLKLDGSCYGIIMKSENGSCYKITVQNGGQIVTSLVNCNN